MNKRQRNKQKKQTELRKIIEKNNVTPKIARQLYKEQRSDDYLIYRFNELVDEFNERYDHLINNLIIPYKQKYDNRLDEYNELYLANFGTGVGEWEDLTELEKLMDKLMAYYKLMGIGYDSQFEQNLNKALIDYGVTAREVINECIAEGMRAILDDAESCYTYIFLMFNDRKERYFYDSEQKRLRETLNSSDEYYVEEQTGDDESLWM